MKMSLQHMIDQAEHYNLLDIAEYLRSHLPKPDEAPCPETVAAVPAEANQVRDITGATCPLPPAFFFNRGRIEGSRSLKERLEEKLGKELESAEFYTGTAKRIGGAEPSSNP